MEATPQSMPGGGAADRPDGPAASDGLATADRPDGPDGPAASDGLATADRPDDHDGPAAPDGSATADGEAAVAAAYAELATLRGRVLALEAELAETHRRANTAIAAAQERAYWLDRWHVDLNALMLHRSAVATRAVLRALRGMVRRLRRFSRAIR